TVRRPSEQNRQRSAGIRRRQNDCLETYAVADGDHDSAGGKTWTLGNALIGERHRQCQHRKNANRDSHMPPLMTAKARYCATSGCKSSSSDAGRQPAQSGHVKAARAFIAPIAHELEWTLFCTTRPRLDGVAKSSPSGSQLIMTATIHYYVTCVSGRIAAIVLAW